MANGANVMIGGLSASTTEIDEVVQPIQAIPVRPICELSTQRSRPREPAKLDEGLASSRQRSRLWRRRPPPRQIKSTLKFAAYKARRMLWWEQFSRLRRSWRKSITSRLAPAFPSASKPAASEDIARNIHDAT